MTTTQSRSKTSRGIFITLLAISGAVGYVVLVFLPTQKAMAAARSQLRERQKFIAQTHADSAHEATLRQQLDATRKFVDSWRKSAPHGGSLENLLGELAALANSNNVVLHRLTPEDLAATATLREHRLNLEIEGSFLAIVEFLRGIESRPNVIWSDELKMQPLGEDGKVVQCALKLLVFADNREKSG